MAKDKITKEEIRERRFDYTYNLYSHGGSRIYIEGGSGDRHLLVDTYHDEAFADYINECTRKYFELKV